MTANGSEAAIEMAPSPVAELGSGFRKALTGIKGLDEVTGGGLPASRPTLVCGPAGCGKTLLAMEFLVHGALEYDEPGVFMAFEETAHELVENVASMGYDLQALQDDGSLVIDHVRVVASDMKDVGGWDLEGLFLRLGHAIDEVGARRVVLDTIETLFGAFDDASLVRTELRRLFGWLKERGVTAIITGERGDGTLTRYGIEEYVSDCVIVLDHRVSAETSTRRLRVLKYRGSDHGTNEYPFLIGSRGVSVMPITSVGLEHAVSREFVSSGVESMDAMLGGPGVYRGSSVLISGAAGTGKSTLAAQFCAAACARGERALYLAFEESAAQIVRNMSSVGMDLSRWVDAGLLAFRCVRPSLLGLEAHLAAMLEAVEDHAPDVVIMDPVSDLLVTGNPKEAAAMLMRQVDFLKNQGITAFFAGLSVSGTDDVGTQEIGSLIDTWLLAELARSRGRRQRVLSVIKSRGTAHSHDTRELALTAGGIRIGDIYEAPGGLG